MGMNAEGALEKSAAEERRGPIPLKAAIFDMDGTLVDSMGTWHNVAVRYLARRGIEAEPGLGDKLFTMTSVTSAEYLIERYGLRMSIEELARGLSEEMREYYSEEAELKPGAREILEAFSGAGIPMDILTSTDGYLVRIALERLGIGGFFRSVMSSGDLGMSKGEPEIFLRTAQDLGARPEEICVFEDGLYAVRTAAEVGFPTVAVYDRISEADQPALQAESSLYVRSLREITLEETEKTVCIIKS